MAIVRQNPGLSGVLFIWVLRWMELGEETVITSGWRLSILILLPGSVGSTL